MTDRYLKYNACSIPHQVWPADALRQVEKQAADALGTTLYTLMERAGTAAFQVARQQYPDSRHWLILCGNGNNGGDGYVVARLALAERIDVTLLAQESDNPQPEEACIARAAWHDAGGTVHAADILWPDGVDLIIDALSGSGLKSAPRKALALLIEQANQHSAPVVSLDIPSGLAAQTGAAPGAVMHARHTVTFIALTPGLLTGKARDVTGSLHYSALGLEPWLDIHSAPISRLNTDQLSNWLPPRRPTANKSSHGRLVIIGGDSGTAGAICLAAEAALRAGAGLVRVLTRAENTVPLLTARPELMVHELTAVSLDESLEWADVVAIGPGLGQQSWGKKALQKVEHFRKPMLWDADALNLLAISPDTRQNRIITPHPGEAARLLNCSVADIENDRLLAVKRLVKRYGGCAVLKGAGSLVACEDGRLGIVDAGNAGMASGGMGDVLSGIIAALLAQKMALYEAACAGAVAHGAAADTLALRFGTRGMLASDVINMLYPFVNPTSELTDYDKPRNSAPR